MTRRLAWIGPAFGLGLVACAFAPQPLFPVILLLAAALLLLCVPPLRGTKALVCLSAYLCGCLLWTGYQAAFVRPLLAYDGQTLSFSGEILRLDRYSDDMARYILVGELDGRRAKIVCFGADAPCEVGDTLSFTAAYAVPQNTYLFSASDYYAAQGIYLEARPTDFSVTRNDGFSLRRTVISFREERLSVLRTKMTENEAGLLCAMLCGDDAGLETAAQTALYRTGVGHVTAVSGLHLSLICGAAVWLMRRARVGKYTEFGVIFACIILVALFADETYSVLRAGVMQLMVYGARLCGRRTDALNSLCAAFLLLLILSPQAILSASFLLSFSATFAVSVLAPYLTRGMRAAPLKLLAQMTCVTVAVLPVSVLFFDEASTVAPLANLLLIPLCMGILILGILYVITGLPLFLLFAQPICSAVLAIADFCARLPFSHLPIGSRGFDVILPFLAVCVGAVYVLTKNRRAVCAAFVSAALLVCSFAYLFPLLRSDEIRLAVLGETDRCTIVLIADRRASVFDCTGGRKSADYVQKYLADNGIDTVETIGLFDHPISTIPVYDDALCYLSVGQVCVPSGSALTDGLSIRGRKPYFADACTVSGERFCLHCSMDGAVLTAYDTVWSVEYHDGWQICADGTAWKSENTELILRPDGSFTVRPL